MKLEDQVCSLELAKRLKELGVKQESHAYWCEDLGEVTFSADCRSYIKPKCGSHPSAFTVAELGEMLPIEAKDKDGKIYDLKMFKNSENIWVVYYTRYPRFTDLDLAATKDKTEADARAKMLIYLLENKLMEPTAKGREGI